MMRDTEHNRPEELLTRENVLEAVFHIVVYSSSFKNVAKELMEQKMK